MTSEQNKQKRSTQTKGWTSTSNRAKGSRGSTRNRKRAASFNPQVNILRNRYLALEPNKYFSADETNLCDKPLPLIKVVLFIGIDIGRFTSYNKSFFKS